MIIAELPAYADETEFEYFELDIDDCFKNYLGKKVFVEGEDLGWRNLTGEHTFTLKKTDQIWRELTPESADFSFCLLYTSPSPRDGLLSRMPSSA